MITAAAILFGVAFALLTGHAIYIVRTPCEDLEIRAAVLTSCTILVLCSALLGMIGSIQWMLS